MSGPIDVRGVSGVVAVGRRAELPVARLAGYEVSALSSDASPCNATRCM